MEEADDTPGEEAGARFTIRTATFSAVKPAPGLYLVATPIGNLSDVTLRALEVIAAADRLYCEDTRVTAKLLARYGIRRRYGAYHEHSGEAATEALLAELEAGRSVALVSDAGTPLVSDPGFRLGREAAARGIAVVPVPGASAPLAALLASGLPSDSFFFAGFPPQKEAARRTRLQALLRVPGTLLFFEAPHRIAESLSDMAAVFGNRPAAVCRELTKAYETIYRGTLPELAARFAAEENVRGEIVVCVGPPPQEEAASEADADAILKGLLAEMKPAKAAQEAARLTGLPRRDLYARALSLKGEA
ncbi:16S rRNA (cytidine(1402)-2'-O)-methyltransferase [Antarcticirhabdus aurantiaca]|uniref:16S rRNA (Cytidine(1402)-2'-O)-methyltransferase n=1 Tax=Antarcticirhabdus aurantiaca TaxID=2606717 RepID=A0ACD4NS02_9HYPH|nr:16S rRNA (cytidine(1402)-2'-O)-methyltransferase [Antarcticirhabdus aurantiaca]WAJ29572.1 16S rRNA (cytidine(1402)-2'-O)-methyltransferase [Jeongeuplla avenae]